MVYTWKASLTVDKRWAMINTVLPFMALSMASCTRYSLSASKALVAYEAVDNNIVFIRSGVQVLQRPEVETLLHVYRHWFFKYTYLLVVCLSRMCASMKLTTPMHVGDMVLLRHLVCTWNYED